jgi:hypothetical protein
MEPCQTLIDQWIEFRNPYKSLLFIQSGNYGLNQEIAQFQRKIDKPIPQICGEKQNQLLN